MLIKAYEAAMQRQPDAQLAYKLGTAYAQANDLPNAVPMLRKAVALAPAADAEFLAKANFQLAGVLFNAKEYAQARQACLNALKTKPKWGKPYLLIGQMYAASSAACANENSMDKQAVYWAAVDKFAKAKQVDLTVKAEADALIATYKKYFPTKDEAFFRGISPGKSYTVGCWIGETTVVRFEK